MSLPTRLLCAAFLLLRSGLVAQTPFGIQVVDEQTGRGVPLITLTTTNHITHTSDSAGWIAFDEPGLMEREVFFKVSGPGYAAAKDGFGIAGVRLTPRHGEQSVVKVTRVNIAERLYRITGQGIYRDSTLLGLESPLPRPNLFADVMGQDSVQVAKWRGRLFWIWGDTNRPEYPLGNFHSTAAWSDLADQGGVDPALGIHFEHITGEDGRVAKMIPVKEPGPVWLFGMLTVQDSDGAEHLVAHYSRQKDLGTRVEHGLAEYDESKRIFIRSTQLGEEFQWQYPQHQAVRASGTAQDGTQREYFYFAGPFCLTRVPAIYDQVMNPSSYEALIWSQEAERHVWQSAQPPLTQEQEAALVRSKKMPLDKALLQVTDAATGKLLHLHAGSVRWNAHRQRWVLIAVQQEGAESYLGEVWYAESTQIEGPWRKAVKIASHPRYSFYNPDHHDFFDQKDGRFIFFEGTYAETFSGNPTPTPRYDYNQLMYRLDLDDPRLKAAQTGK
ncbi:MAG: hypothetical protein IPK32_19715 [Verrucomicrobiaceae bacterium]|nr:hypothetical protein [Verrucomicrobiaceae bacterium]